jgi:hypothetical protein
MAVVGLEIKSRQALAGGQEFGNVGRYAQFDGTAHFAVDPAHSLNRGITDIALAVRDGAGLVHFSADFRILTPEDPRRGNHRLLFDVPNRGNRLALATFNRVPRPINPSAPTDSGDGFLMNHGYTVVWCGWQHDVPAADGLMRIKVPEAQQAGRPVSGRLLVSFQPNAPSQVQLLSNRGHRPYPSNDLNDPDATLLVRDGDDLPPRAIPREDWSFARLEAGRVVPDPNHVYLAAGFEPGKIYHVIYATTGAPVIGLGLLAARATSSRFCAMAPPRAAIPAPARSAMPMPSARRKAGAICANSSISASTRTKRSAGCSTACWCTSPVASAAATSTSASASLRPRSIRR